MEPVVVSSLSYCDGVVPLVPAEGACSGQGNKSVKFYCTETPPLPRTRAVRLEVNAPLENLLQVNFLCGELGFSIQHGMSGEKKHPSAWRYPWNSLA